MSGPLPIRPRKLPSSVATFTTTVNGRLVVNGTPAPELLRDPGDKRGPLLIPCSYGMQAMHLWAMQERGIKLETTGRGRTLARQTSLFLERMTPTYDATVNTTADSRTVVIDQRNVHPDLVPGKRWFKRRGVAAVASPGTSNHGFYCADDLSEEHDGTAGTDPIRQSTVDFLVGCAHLFGWTWEMQSEPWHVTWMAGDVIPPFAQEVLRRHGVPFPGSQPPEVVPKGPRMRALRPDPIRLIDTRPLPGRVMSGQAVRVSTRPAGERPDWAMSALVQVTITDTVGAGVLSLGAGDRPAPATSNHNWVGPTIPNPNLALVRLDTNGEFLVHVGGAGDAGTHFFVDMQGWAE